jgi:hypothetical protein
VRAAFLHPVGLTVLGVSFALTIAVNVVPALYSWSSRSVWLVVWGLVLYGAVVAAQRLLPAATPPARDELLSLLNIRDQIAGRLVRLREPSARLRRRELETVLEDALRQIDEEITPSMRQVLERNAELAEYLAKLESGKLPLPEPMFLARVRTIYERQRATIAACVQQAANAAAALEAILQEMNDATVSEQAQAWAEDLAIVHDALREVISDYPQAEQAPERSQPTTSAPPPASGVPDDRPKLEDGESQPGDATVLDTLLVTIALRRLHNAALLAESELISRLPHTMLETLHLRLNGESADPSPSERAQALQKFLIDGIEALKPLDRDDGITPQSMQYRILREEYVDGHPTQWIETRYHISESKLHRDRRRAINLLTGNLVKQEERMARAHQSAALHP